jgi:hypothetical protein
MTVFSADSAANGATTLADSAIAAAAAISVKRLDMRSSISLFANLLSLFAGWRRRNAKHRVSQPDTVRAKPWFRRRSHGCVNMPESAVIAMKHRVKLARERHCGMKRRNAGDVLRNFTHVEDQSRQFL